MFVERAYVPEALRPKDKECWLYSVPSVAALIEHGLEFTHPITFLVGDNGSGKSTLVEALAEGFRMDSHGGRAAVRTGRPDPAKTPLGEVLSLKTTLQGARMLAGPRRKRKGFFLRAETAHNMTENLGGVPGYWEDDTSQMSHGEAYLAVLATMFREPGFYVMDEPESALSFTACIHLVALMHELGGSGAQVVCATHSPILASTPGADIIEVGAHGMRRVNWEDLELVHHWRRYLNDPRAYLHHVIDS